MSDEPWYLDKVWEHILDGRWFQEALEAEARQVGQRVGLDLEISFVATKLAHNRWRTSIALFESGEWPLTEEAAQVGFLETYFALLFFCLIQNQILSREHYVDNTPISTNEQFKILFARKESVALSFCLRAFFATFSGLFAKRYPHEIKRYDTAGWVKEIDSIRQDPKYAVDFFLRTLSAI